MCGIVGYIGNKQALPIVLDGLKRLEYRGYDSAGVAVYDGNRIHVAKKTGRVADLVKHIGADSMPGTVSISHTRWATHGRPNDRNAHPHVDCHGAICVVHNGIIENYAALKRTLAERGHRFASETDTEVLAHLIEEAFDGNLERAVIRALRKVHGTYGLAVLAASDPQKIVAARNSSPLIVGIGQDEYLIASDASAILEHTKRVVYPEDGEVVVVSPEGFRILDLEEGTVEREVQELDWTIEEAEKGGYPHFMLKEIYEGPAVLENAMRGRMIPETGTVKLGGLEQVSGELGGVSRLLVSACGTAYYAGLVGEYMLEEYGGIPVEVSHASEFRYREQPLDPKTAFLAISQSGETADTLAAVREAKRRGLLTLGIVNVVGSSIARETDAGVYNHAGPEIGVASTKAFLSQLAVLALLAVFFGRQRGMTSATGEAILRELAQLPGKVNAILEWNAHIQEVAERYYRYESFAYIGRKYNYPIALEGALKLKEISYIHAEGYPAGEMKHGPIALIDEHFPTLVMLPSDSVYEKVASNIEEIKARGGKVIAVGTHGNRKIERLADEIMWIPKTLEMLTPILAVVPLQLFAYHCAVLRGCDVDKPRNLAKSVTVE